MRRSLDVTSSKSRRGFRCRWRRRRSTRCTTLAVDFRDALVIGISQSGESTDTNLVLERARAQGALTIGITNEAGSAMAKLADEVFLVRAGREKSVAATKTYTGQVLVLYLLAYALGADLRLDDMRRLPDWAASALELEKMITALSERYRFMEHAVVVGRGLNYANAFEFALKMMETSYVVAERFSSADFLHGPIAMVERVVPCFPVRAFGRDSALDAGDARKATESEGGDRRHHGRVEQRDWRPFPRGRFD